MLYHRHKTLARKVFKRNWLHIFNQNKNRLFKMEFDLSKIKLSKNDIKIGLILPSKPSQELAEFVGILIGDGYLYNNFNKYRVGIVDNPKTDFDYFSEIQTLILKLFNKKTYIKKGGRGLRIVFNSKGVFTFLINVVGLPYGKGKGEKVVIPEIILKKKDCTFPILRGIFDTDGSIFTSNKKRAPNYPCIELTTTSIALAKQVKEILVKKRFRVAGIRKYNYSFPSLPSYKVTLYGKENMKLWFNKIGFSNPPKQNKLLKIINGNAGTFTTFLILQKQKN